MTTSPGDFYAKAVAQNPAPSLEGGASGYFSAPQAALDPNLFDGHMLKPEVRAFINQALFGELKMLGLKLPSAWTFVWLAGSGISYQWAGDRGNGDLDVLLGVDFPAFLRTNPDWGGMGEDQFAAWLNTHLRAELWPLTASTQFGDQVYEVTFYLNPGTGRDISSINPYAAYDLRKNAWTVTPPQISSTDPHRMYPDAWYKATEGDSRMTEELVQRYEQYASLLAAAVPGSAPWHNAGDALRFVTEQAEALWNNIHGNRHEAFQPGGQGYGDYNNFRWQVAKERGVVHALKGIRTVREAANDERDAELYGGPIAPADEALSRAALVSQHRPGMPR